MVELEGRRILVLGLGRTGKSVLRYFAAKNIPAAGYAASATDDERAALAREFSHAFFYFAPLKEVLYTHHFDLLVLSPGFSIFLPEIREFVAKGGEITGDVALWLENIRKPEEKVIAITGSNGKSTVTDLVGFLAREAGLDTEVAANIGLPVLDAYLNREEKPAALWVLELSSFQLETIRSLNATAATCLNISADHLDRYPDLLTYAYYKDQIFNGAKTQVLNADDPLVAAMRRPRVKTLWFSLEKPKDYWLAPKKNTAQLMSGDKELIDSAALALTGKHNMANIFAALALCEAAGLKKKKILAALPRYRGLAHRIDKVAEVKGVTFVDDSKGTNVGATLAALDAAPGPVALILGGLAKGQDFTPLQEIVKKKVTALFLIGKDAKRIAEVFADSGVKSNFYTTLEDATRAAFSAASPDSWVLLSPACASMDMFRDYAHRSEVFRKEVEELLHESA